MAQFFASTYRHEQVKFSVQVLEKALRIGWRFSTKSQLTPQVTLGTSYIWLSVYTKQGIRSSGEK
jgi:hypothetical protein